MSNRLDSSIFGDHEEPDDLQDVDEHGNPHQEQLPPVTSRREARELAEAERRDAKASRGRPSVLRRLVVIALALLVVGGGSYIGYAFIKPIVAGMSESDDYEGPGTGEVMVKVENGMAGQAIARTLESQGVIKTAKAFTSAASATPKAAGIQPGVYALKKEMSAADALTILIDPANRITSEVVIPEGLWAVEIYARLSKATGIPVAEYEKAAKDADALGLPPSAKGNIEGYLFPAQYSFDPDTTAASHLKAMVDQSKKRLTALGISPEEMEHTIIVASLIEGEARTPEDKAKVSRVIANRLTKGMTLGMDSTVNYIFKKRGVPTADMLKSPSPYNTRIKTGLPPGPIANPGEDAITAAVKPADGPWTFFVTVNLDTGETKFTDDPAVFQTYADEFTAWCAANKGKC